MVCDTGKTNWPNSMLKNSPFPNTECDTPVMEYIQSYLWHSSKGTGMNEGVGIILGNHTEESCNTPNNISLNLKLLYWAELKALLLNYEHRARATERWLLFMKYLFILLFIC